MPMLCFRLWCGSNRKKNKMNMKIKAAFLAAAITIVIGGPTLAHSVTAKVLASDKQFMVKAAQGGMGEVALGQLAVSHGSGSDVKKFGERMVTDHTKANNRLIQVAAGKGVTLPKVPGPEEQATKARLSKLSGAAFDKAYVDDMVKDHEKDVADFQKEAASGKDPEVKMFAATTLPTLKMHLQMARSLQGGVSTAKM